MTNRLAASQSLYLRKHAENPIDWYPWGEEALEAASRDNKPIFLSVGYSSCHWCTVMEGEAFSDDAIALYLNEHFIPIKVDREERPDLDSIYMSALQAMTGQGGWPMNLFLTPRDLVPFYGGTYFPIDPRYGRPGFLEVLKALRQFFETEPSTLIQQNQKLMAFLQNTTVLQSAETLNPALLALGLEASTAIMARPASAPSFPMMPYALLALQGERLLPPTNAPSPALRCGLDLALGGIFDHVGGGFHRYTVDASWTVPHFEKMLYDNGQIVEFLADLWSAGHREPSFERAIALTARWLAREMTAPEGYFYAAQDADTFVRLTDVEPEEGRFYVWQHSELESLLKPDEWEALKATFDLQPNGNFEQGSIVLQRQQPGALSELTEGAIAKLFQVRYGALPDRLTAFPPARNNAEAKQTDWPGRIPPVTDTKAIVSWNSLMISGLARAAAVFSEPAYLATATAAAQFILDRHWVGGRLHRLYYEGQPAIPAQSEDYAFFIKALLDLHQASLAVDTAEAAEAWLTAALATQAEFDSYLWAVEGGGYFNASRDVAPELILRERSWMDSATPSANGVAIANLIRLAFLQEDLTLLDRAEQALKTFSSAMQSSPPACPSLFAALDWYANATVIRSSRDRIREWMARFYWPVALYTIDPQLPERAMGLVCKGLTCLPIADTESAFLQQVNATQSRSRPHS
ncbi:thioredoxin domain-containing protein [Altericista sp. CCNU0014]|uniref:thioredoxin domain-containing protein n=1 Tax=Altericista sp. CCNU0014 TaxID=3082949 RepID=UPI00384FCF2B